MNWERPVRIIGLGSVQGDDAVGWQVVRRLKERIGRRLGLEFYLLAGGQDLLDVLDGRGTLVLVDAVIAGAVPGTIHELSWPDLRLQERQPGSTHGLGPAESLRLAAALGLLPSRVVVRGIEGTGLNPEEALTPAVAAAVPALVECLENELHRPEPTTDRP